MSEANQSGARICIVGGGVAGVESLLALRTWPVDARLTLMAPDPDFVYKPLLVEEPFGLGPPEQYALEPLAEESGAEFLLRAVSAVDPEAHMLALDDGSALDYDFLVVCIGGRFVPALRGAITFPDPAEPLHIDPILDRAVGGASGSPSWFRPASAGLCRSTSSR